LSDPLKVAVAGLGTVGAGTVKLLERQRRLLSDRCGRHIQVTAVAARDRSRDRGVDLSGYAWYDDALDMARQSDADVFVELIGGADGIAKSACEAAIDSGKHVVTANKALMAVHGAELAARAEAAGLAIGYEAGVAGGIPIVKALREGLAANSVSRITGILNGTCNYILTVMRETGRSFDEVLAEAQELGYAEADPAFDIDGIDAAHKLAILTSIAFGTKVDFDSVYTEGIANISPLDIDYADTLGYRIKLLAIGQITDHGVEQRVHPCMVAKDSAIAQVEGVYNAVLAQGDWADDTVYRGRGAGEGPTASAVVADIIDIARGNIVPTFGVPAALLTDIDAAPIDRHAGAYYVRLTVKDQPGVIADVAAALRDENVSLESMLQRGRSATEAVPVVLITHETLEAAMDRALARIEALPAVLERPCRIRIEEF